MQVRFGETQTLDAKNHTIGGYSLVIEAVHTTNNTAFAATLLDTDKVTAKIILTRGGKQEVIFHDVLTPILIASHFNDAGLDQILGGSSSIVRAADTSVKAINRQYYTLDLGGVVNLKGNETLSLELYVPQDAAGTGVDTSASSIEFNYSEAIGYEEGTPVINTRSIQGGRSTEQIDAGDDITAVFFVNTDKKTILSADDVITQMTLRSDKLTLSDNKRELEGKRFEQFDTAALANARYNCFAFHRGVELDGVRLDLTLNSANVSNGKNWLVFIRKVITAQTLNRTIAMTQKHDKELMVKASQK